MTECTCWVPYPNRSHLKPSGKWKCTDCYENVRQLETIPLKGLPFPKYIHKTKCIRKGSENIKTLQVTEGTLKFRTKDYVVYNYDYLLDHLEEEYKLLKAVKESREKNNDSNSS